VEGAAPRRRLSRGRRALFGAVAALLLVLLLEGALRLAGLPVGLVRSFGGLWQRDPDALASQPGLFRPGTHRVAYPPELAYGVTIDALGLRGTDAPALEPAPGRTRVLCLGDSVTFGFHVEDDQTYPARLQARLGPAVEVLNAGCGHLTIADERRWFAEKLAALRPKVVVLQFCGNDVDPSEQDDRPGQYAQVLADAGGPSLADRLRTTAIGEAQLHLAIALKRSREPSPSLAQHPEVPDERWARYEAELRALRDLVAKGGATLVLVPFPDLVHVRGTGPSPYEVRLRAMCEALAIGFRGPLEAFRAAAQGDPDGLYHWPLDPHASAKGCEVFAGAVEALLRERGLVPTR
jgi:lysophospholipase L1-like esterase